MKVVTFYFWNLELTLSLYRFLLPFFTICGGSNMWKDLEITRFTVIYLCSSRVKDTVSANAHVSAF